MTFLATWWDFLGIVREGANDRLTRSEARFRRFSEVSACGELSAGRQREALLKQPVPATLKIGPRPEPQVVLVRLLGNWISGGVFPLRSLLWLVELF